MHCTLVNYGRLTDALILMIFILTFCLTTYAIKYIRIYMYKMYNYFYIERKFLFKLNIIIIITTLNNVYAYSKPIYIHINIYIRIKYQVVNII